MDKKEWRLKKRRIEDKKEWKWKERRIEEVKQFAFLGYILQRNGRQETRFRNRARRSAAVM